MMEVEKQDAASKHLAVHFKSTLAAGQTEALVLLGPPVARMEPMQPNAAIVTGEGEKLASPNDELASPGSGIEHDVMPHFTRVRVE